MERDCFRLRTNHFSAFNEQMMFSTQGYQIGKSVGIFHMTNKASAWFNVMNTSCLLATNLASMVITFASSKALFNPILTPFFASNTTMPIRVIGFHVLAGCSMNSFSIFSFIQFCISGIGNLLYACTSVSKEFNQRFWPVLGVYFDNKITNFFSRVFCFVMSISESRPTPIRTGALYTFLPETLGLEWSTANWTLNKMFNSRLVAACG